MSEQNLEELFDDVVTDNEPQDNDNETPEKIEDKPAPKGYMSREAWIEAGKDPDEWVSPEVFRERGERIRMKQELQRDFENRLKNVNLLHQKQLEVMRNELIAKRDDAIDTADRDAVKRFDKQLKELDDLEELNRAEEVQPIVKPQEVVEWEDENPWVNNPADPRLPLAQRTYAKAINEGKTPATALRLVDKVLAEKFTDPSRKPAQIAESSRPGAGKGDSEKISMKNLTSEERKIWEAGFFDDEKQFLKAVADSRKAGK